MRIACINPGSSSIKLSVLDGDVTQAEASIAAAATDADLSGVISEGIAAVAVRVVHGGAEFREATRVTADVLARLKELSWLAPLHNPASMALIERLRQMSPDLPVVACFDTAFHATLPGEAYTYPVPVAWSEKWGLRRYGFHGLSHAHSSHRATELLGHRPSRLVTCHLGAGASLCAVRDGESVDTTMGFTPMDGLMMATRSGSIDPGIILFALRQGLSPDDLERALDQESGVLGVSGISSDFRDVVAAADAGDASADLAVGIYRHRLVQGIASMAASLGGLDALVFTGGVGENQRGLRKHTCAALAFLGILLADDDPGADGEDRRLATTGAVDVMVIRAREDLEMARQATALLGAG